MTYILVYHHLFVCSNEANIDPAPRQGRDPPIRRVPPLGGPARCTGLLTAHTVGPAPEGKSPAAVPFARQIIGLAQRSGKGWIEQPWRNPDSGKNGLKTTYVLRIDDVVLEAGLTTK